MRSLFGILFVLLLACSCANDPGDRTPDAYPVRFASGLSGEVSSRAANDSWEANDKVGIYMVPATTVEGSANFSAPLSVLNKQYQTSGAGHSVAMAAVGSDAIYYPVDGSSVNFVAYYPYKTDTHTTNNNIYKVDVATQSLSKDIDLIYYKGTGAPYSKASTDPVSMEFEHQLSKMIINLIPANGTVHFTSASVQLKGFPTTANFNLSTGVLDTQGVVVDMTPATISATSDNANFEAILVPHSNGYTRTVVFTIDGNSYTYTLSSTSVFTAGVAQNYNFKFTGSKIVLAQSTIVNWDGGTVAWGDYLLTATTIKFDVVNTLTTGNTVTLSTNAPPDLAFTLSEDANSNTGNPSWITPVSLSNGTADTDMGDGWTKYTLTFGTNFNIAATGRTGYIRLQVGGLTLAIRVTQAAGVGLYLHDPSESLFDNQVALGKTGHEFTIETNAQEDIVLTPSSWITNLTKSRGAVDANGVSTWTVKFDVATNTGIAREGTIKVAVGGLEKTVTVKQVAMYVNDPVGAVTNLNVLAKAYSFTIETNAQDAQGSVVPTAAGVSWITGLSATRADKPGESGNGIYVWTVAFSVSLNTTTSARSGDIEVTIGGIKKTVTVSQVTMYVNDPSPASFSNLAYGGESNRTFTIVTNAQDASVTPVVGSYTWITANAVRGTVDGNGVSTWTVTFSVSANPDTSARSGDIEVTIGGIKKTISVSQAGKPPYPTEVNCFMVAPNSTLQFQPGRAFSIGGAAKNVALFVNELWDDSNCVSSVTVTGQGDDAVITVNTSGNQGNALIAVRTGSTSGIIYWSYHIWVVPAGYKPDDFVYVATNARFMDRNLGATRTTLGGGAGSGLFYQWGRKDPFPELPDGGGTPPNGTGTFSLVARPATSTVASSIQNPEKYYYQTSGNYDWLSTQDDALWGHNTTKSVYDPCPEGWRVPTHGGADASSPWSGMTTSTAPWTSTAGGQGRTWGTIATYPAAGYRYGSNSSYDGELSNVGSGGCYWSASPYGTNAWNLYFNGSSVGVSDSNGRVQGCSVRCAQE